MPDKTRLFSRKLITIAALLPAVGALGLATAAQAKDHSEPAGDPVHGKVVFKQCQICHSIDAGKNMIGPSLHDVVGRKAGTEAGFSYSPAMKKSGITWTPHELSEFLTAPMKTVSGTRMTFPGLPKAKDRADVIAFLSKN